MKGPISKGKLSKKAKQALDREARQTWGISPVSRKTKNAKLYDRKRFQRRPDGGDAGGFFLSA